MRLCITAKSRRQPQTRRARQWLVVCVRVCAYVYVCVCACVCAVLQPFGIGDTVILDNVEYKVQAVYNNGTYDLTNGEEPATGVARWRILTPEQSKDGWTSFLKWCNNSATVAPTKPSHGAEASYITDNTRMKWLAQLGSDGSWWQEENMRRRVQLFWPPEAMLIPNFEFVGDNKKTPVCACCIGKAGEALRLYRNRIGNVKSHFQTASHFKSQRGAGAAKPNAPVRASIEGQLHAVMGSMQRAFHLNLTFLRNGDNTV